MKLLISDWDGTLFVSDPVQTERNFAAVHQWINKGNLFAVATSRGLYDVQTIRNKLNVRMDYVGNNGAEILFSDDTLTEKLMSGEVLLQLKSIVDQHHLDVCFHTNYEGHWRWSGKECYPFTEENEYSRWRDVFELIDFDAFNPEIQLAAIKVLTPASRRDVVKALLDQQLGPEVHTACSDVDLIDINSALAGKGSALHELCRHYHIDLHDTLALGDSENDLSMLNAAGISGCIQTAEDSVRAAASEIVSSAEQFILHHL